MWPPVKSKVKTQAKGGRHLQSLLAAESLTVNYSG